jgi:hypothetical protein
MLMRGFRGLMRGRSVDNLTSICEPKKNMGSCTSHNFMDLRDLLQA